jgi:hypothetical protein
MEKAEEFISQEEMMRMYAEREAKPKEQIKKKEFRKGEGASNQGKSSKKGPKLPEKSKPITEREYNFTPLNTSVAEVFMQIRNDPGLKRPEKMRPLQKSGACVSTVTTIKTMAMRPKIASLYGWK